MWVLGLAAVLAAIIGSGAAAAALDLRRGLDVLTAWAVVCAAQTAAVTLLVGGLLAALRPVPVAAGSLVLAVGELVWAAGPRRAACVRSLRAVAGALRPALRLWRHPAVVVLAVLVAAQYAWRAACAHLMAKVDYDSLAYHWLGPDVWVQAGRIMGSPQNIFADTYPDDQGLLSCWSGLFLGTMRYTWLSHVPFFVMGALAVAAIARHFGAGRHWATVAALLWLATPVTYLQAATGMVDTACAATALAAFQFALSMPRVAGREGTGFAQLPPHVAACGLATGLAVGVKSSNLITALFAALLVLVGYFQIVRAHRDRLGTAELSSCKSSALKRIALCYLLPVLALGGYWYVHTAVVYGSPFYPVSMFGLPGRGTMDAVLGNDRFMPLVLRGVPGGTFGEALRSWWTDLSRQTYRDYGYSPPTGGFGFLFLTLLVPAATAGFLIVTAGRYQDRGRWVQAIVLVVFALLWIIESPASWRLRMHIVLPGLAAAFAAVALTRLARRLPAPMLLATPALTAAVAVVMWWTTDPTYYQVQQGTQVNTVSFAQAVQLMRTGQGRSGELVPNHDFTALERLPRGSTVAWAWSGGAMDYAHNLIGEQLQRRLLVLQWPQDATALRAQLAAGQARYVILGGASAEPRLLDSVRADSQHFRLIAPVADGRVLYEVNN
ncbi:hypothetical protein [Nocardia sp. NPDC052566]|uniref:hypothetical protein n=1 Tax=Nocardia sp. NPDC052566 TaxID=3364330 RepID=UPI0037C7B8BD